MSSRVRVEVKERVLYIELNGPRPHNPLSLGVLSEIDQILRRAAADPEIAVALMYGSSGLFPSGLDVIEMFAVSNETAASSGCVPQVSAWRAFPKPTICVVERTVRNLALSFVEASDVCVAGERAAFQHDELSIGLLPCAGSTQHLPRLIGPKLAAGMLFGGWTLSASDALLHGLVSHVVPSGEAFAVASSMASKLASNPTSLSNHLRRAPFPSPQAGGGRLETGGYVSA